MGLECSDFLVLVHSPHGSFDIDLTLSELELTLGAGFLRVHSNWLVAISKVREMQQRGGAHLLVGEAGEPGGRLQVPIERERFADVRGALLGGAIGLRRRGRQLP